MGNSQINIKPETSILGQTLKDKRNRLGLTLEQLSKLVGFTHGHLSMCETGKRIPSDMLLSRLAERLELDYGELRQIAESERYERDHERMETKYFQIEEFSREKGLQIAKNMIHIPILGTVPTQAPLSSEPETAICVPSNWISDRDQIFALQISDDTMTGRLENTDLVAVKRGLDPENNDLVIARVNDMIMAKSIEFIGDIVVLRSTNGQPETMHFTGKDKEQVEVIGKVIFRITQAS